MLEYSEQEVVLAFAELQYLPMLYVLLTLGLLEVL
jgi:hypothetical protein